MDKLLKKRILIISIFLALLLLVNIAVSYSYYLGKVVGNESNTTLSFTSAGIKVQYENNSGEITESNILSGWTTTKSFSLSSSISENDFTNGNSKLWYEIILYVDQNDFPSDIITYTLTPSETILGTGTVAEARTNAGIATGTNAEGISIGVGYFTVGENKHDYNITFNYVGNGSEYGNYPDNTFSVHIGAKVVISSVLNIDLDGGSIEGGTTKYVSKGGTINLPIPIKNEALFSGWIITSGNGEIDGNNVTVNDEVLNITAVWTNKIINSVLVINLDGGSSTQDTINNIKTGQIYSLVEPTRDGYLFRGWELVSGNADLSGNKLIAYDENVKIVALWESVVPVFTYLKSDGTEASYFVVNDGGSNWRIKFLESGTLTFATYGNAESGIDVFLVGGGGAGGASTYVNDENPLWGGGGGGGGYTATKNVPVVNIGTNYSIVVGAGGTMVSGGSGNKGGETSAFGYSVNGGYGGYVGASVANGRKGGNGGSGGGSGCQYTEGSVRAASGAGGSDGANGGGGRGGTGQGTTTREFGESSGTLYAGGGGGAKGAGGSDSAGGSGGGAAGNDGNAAANLGGGGGGGRTPGNGGSGVVIIRNARG